MKKNYSTFENMMKRQRMTICRLGFAALVAAPFLQTVQAQVFTWKNNELLLGFRKTGNYQENYEVVVNIGAATNYVDAPAGTTLTVPNFSLSQLVPGCFSSLSNLHWSVDGYVRTNVVTPLPGYVNNTMWLTVPRSSPGVPAAAPQRQVYTLQGNVIGEIKSIFVGAASLSGAIGSSNQFNTPSFVREPVNNVPGVSQTLSAFISGTVSADDSTFQDTWTEDVETATPSSFTGSSIADFYEIRPTTDSLGNPVVDPHTGLAGGPAYYVGYFTFNSNGTMTFTRASASQPLPPAPQLVKITRTADTTTVYFTTTNGPTYTLYYTDTAGLTAPILSWTALPTTVTGNGQTNHLDDVTSDAPRFYRVGAH